MRIGLIGDTHYTNKAPSRRLDDFWETQKRKTRLVLDIFRDRRCDYVLQAGDLFDNPMVSYQVISELIDIFKNYAHWIGRPVGVVFGQHDIFGHSSATLPNSPLAVMESARVITIINQNGLVIGHKSGDKWPHISQNRAMVYGAGFGQDIPTPESTDDFNILVAHRMVGDRPLFPDQELENPTSFLTQNPAFDLILVGDYHYRFVSRDGNRVIINCGALVRKSISKFDLEHEPAVAVFDTESRELEVIKLEVDPVDRIFDLTPVQKRDDSKLRQFIDEIKRQHGDSCRNMRTWRDKLIKVMDARGAGQEVRKIINESLESIHE